MKEKIRICIENSKVFFMALYYSLRTILAGTRTKAENNLNKSVLLVGNGPSLSDINLLSLASSYDVACVNYFACQSELFFALKPKFYFLLDPFYFTDEVQKNDKYKQLIFNLNKVDWKMTIITPQRRFLCISNSNIVYEHITTYSIKTEHMNRFLLWLYNHNLVMCGLQNVLCGAIHYFLVRRFGRVFLCGVDMDEFRAFTINSENHVIATYNHFYGVEVEDCTEKGIIEKGTFYKWLSYYAQMLAEFHTLSLFAVYQGVEVKNLTLDSYIDCFDKIKLDN